MPALAAVPPMHEKMQWQTDQQQQEEQWAEPVGAVLGQQKKCRDGEKSQHGQIDLDGARVPMWDGIKAVHGVTFARRDQSLTCR